MDTLGERDRGLRVDVDVNVDVGGRCGVLGLLALLVSVGDLLVDPLLLAARVGELVGVLERACE